MQIVGNILLLLSMIAGWGLFKTAFFRKMPGGDARMGHALATLFLVATLWICLALTTCIIGFSGGFAWLSSDYFTGSGRWALCFPVMVLGATLGAEPNFKGIRFLAPFNAVATPLVMMIAAAVLLNEYLQRIIPPEVVKWALGAVLALNALILAKMILLPVAKGVRIFFKRLLG